MSGRADLKPHYAFLSSPLQSRWAASMPPPEPLGQPRPRPRRPFTTPCQSTDIRPATDWTWLMSGPQSGGQKRLVQRPWPE